MKRILFLFLCLLMSLPLMAQQSASAGEGIIHDMYERYSDSWYDYLTFEQETIFYKGGEEARRQMWYEALSVPGQLMIKFDSLDSGTGVMFRADSQYVFQNNELQQAAPRVHELLVLGFDVYKQDPAQTIEELTGSGFDLSKTYSAEWQGREVYVVGAESEEDSSNQFWIDKERLYFVKLIQRADGVRQETQFNKYEKAGDGWVAPEVLFYRDGQLFLKEIYSNIEVPDKLDPSIFDLEDFESATW